MKRISGLAIIFMSIFVAGCVSAPKLAPLLEMPLPPAADEDIVHVDLEFTSKNKLEDGYVQLKAHKVEPGSSVVINVPENFFDADDKEATEAGFQTEDFFNEAEQQIERVFIGNGFRVLSRSKFEAKLRSLRDESRCDQNDYRCYRSQVSPEVRPILDDLKKQFDNGKIDAVAFAEQSRKFMEEFRTSSAGKRRSGQEDELTDISEVIRAAESGDVQADYILQVNQFKYNSKLKVENNLLHNDMARAFIRQYPEIRSELESGRHVVSCAVIGSQLNAKLIHVKTGEIVWIGEHQLNELSSAVERVQVEFGKKTYVSNLDAVRGFVSRQNIPSYREARYGKTVLPPEWQFKTALIEPVVIGGRCEDSWTDSKETRVLLAREVAKELIGTIRMQ